MSKANYPPEWPEMAQRCKEAAGWQCQICGLQSAPATTNGANMLTVAHVDHDPENPEARLVAMCTTCHIKWDHGLHMLISRHTQQRRKRLELGRKKKGNR